MVACPAQRQSAEAVRRVRDAILKAGGALKADNVYGLELTNGARVLALPGSDNSIRGLTVDAWIVADEAARLADMIQRVTSDAGASDRRALGHAVDRVEPHRPVLGGVGNDDPRGYGSGQPPMWSRFDPKFLEGERRALGGRRVQARIPRHPARRPSSSLFTWDFYERATAVHQPLQPPGPALRPAAPAHAGHPDRQSLPTSFARGRFTMMHAHNQARGYVHEDPSTWPLFLVR